MKTEEKDVQGWNTTCIEIEYYSSILGTPIYYEVTEQSIQQQINHRTAVELGGMI